MYVRGVTHLEKRRKNIGHRMLHELKCHDNFPYTRIEAFRVGNYVAHRAAYRLNSPATERGSVE